MKRFYCGYAVVWALVLSGVSWLGGPETFSAFKGHRRLTKCNHCRPPGALPFVRGARGPVQPKRNVFLGGRARHTQTGLTSIDVLLYSINSSANPTCRDLLRRPPA